MKRNGMEKQWKESAADLRTEDENHPPIVRPEFVSKRVVFHLASRSDGREQQLLLQPGPGLLLPTYLSFATQPQSEEEKSVILIYSTVHAVAQLQNEREREEFKLRICFYWPKRNGPNVDEVEF